MQSLPRFLVFLSCLFITSTLPLYGKQYSNSSEFSNSISTTNTSTPSSYLQDTIQNLLDQLRSDGVVFKDVILLEEVNTYHQLKEMFANLGLVQLNEETIVQSLYAIQNLLEELQEQNISPYLDYDQSTTYQKLLHNYKINPEIYSIKSHVKTYSERLLDLKKASPSAAKNLEDFYENFYKELTASKTLLKQAIYPDGEVRDLSMKKSDLVLLLAALKPSPNGTPAQRHLSPSIKALEVEIYPCECQSQLWFDELRYKLFKLYEKYNSLTTSDKIDLIGYLLHAGRHCSDAKWHAINDAYERFCPEAAATRNAPLGSDPMKNALTMIMNHFHTLKTQSLTSYIHSYIDQSPQDIQSERCTYFNTTWDFLAPMIALPAMESRYRYYLLSLAIIDFPDHFFNRISAKDLFEAVKSELSTFLEQEFLGAFAQVMPNKDLLSIALLRYYYILV